MNDNGILLNYWLQVLARSYCVSPTLSLASAMTYYLERLLTDYCEDCTEQEIQQYCAQLRFWRWRVNAHQH